MNRNKNIEEADAYLGGELTNDEREAFNARLSLDDDLKNDLADVQKVIEGIEGYAFKKHINGIQKQYDEQRQKKVVRLYYSGAIAATILLFVLAFVITQLRSENYYAYFKPYPGVVNVRSDVNNPVEKAFILYDQGAYNEALVEFEKISASHTTDEILFFKALSYIGSENPLPAIALLENLSSTPYKQQVNWYLSLSYLLTEKTQEAKARLSTIRKGEFEYENAQLLLRKIK